MFIYWQLFQVIVIAQAQKHAYTPTYDLAIITFISVPFNLINLCTISILNTTSKRTIFGRDQTSFVPLLRLYYPKKKCNIGRARSIYSICTE